MRTKDAKTQIAKLEESEKEYQNKLTEKINSGHENVKKFVDSVDVHKTNEELTTPKCSTPKTSSAKNSKKRLRTSKIKWALP